jgi:Spy/CpxP family protein refolding chaperone
MKRHNGTALSVLLVLSLMGATAHAQSPTLPKQPRVLPEIVPPLTPQFPLQIPIQFFRTTSGGAWWTNTALVQQLGLTDDQKAKIEKAYENHRQNIVSGTQLLDKEEAQLGKLLDADSIDRNAVYTQIDRVVHARSEMERENSAMTMEMRESLTRAQWTQLQSATPRQLIVGQRFYGWSQETFTGQRGTTPLPSPSGPGQRRGPGQQ